MTVSTRDSFTHADGMAFTSGVSRISLRAVGIETLPWTDQGKSGASMGRGSPEPLAGPTTGG